MAYIPEQDNRPANLTLGEVYVLMHYMRTLACHLDRQDAMPILEGLDEVHYKIHGWFHGFPPKEEPAARAFDKQP